MPSPVVRLCPGAGSVAGDGVRSLRSLLYGLRPLVRPSAFCTLAALAFAEEDEASNLPKRAQRAYKSERSERAKATGGSVPRTPDPCRSAPMKHDAATGSGLTPQG